MKRGWHCTQGTVLCFPPLARGLPRRTHLGDKAIVDGAGEVDTGERDRSPSRFVNLAIDLRCGWSGKEEKQPQLAALSCFLDMRQAGGCC